MGLYGLLEGYLYLSLIVVDIVIQLRKATRHDKVIISNDVAECALKMECIAVIIVMWTIHQGISNAKRQSYKQALSRNATNVHVFDERD
jgi:hypothetical protein